MFPLPPGWAKANPIAVDKDSSEDKKADEQMDKKKFIDSEKEWTVFESKDTRKRKEEAVNNNLKQREHLVTCKSGKPIPPSGT